MAVQDTIDSIIDRNRHLGDVTSLLEHRLRRFTTDCLQLLQSVLNLGVEGPRQGITNLNIMTVIRV